ncbi:MAG TPA: hypothetical protein VES19_05830 [Candidatus Limnocylindrales bacterium]|nr:hypothetical protein [Candidatus Limnocylindrales bacterium]
MKRLARLVGVAALATLFLAGPQAVRAECIYFVMPPATDAVRSAHEVIVGTVVENVGGQLYDFRLRIDHVLRGGAQVGEVRRFDFLYPGWPPARDGDGTVLLNDEGRPIMPCEAIPGSEGNVIALALGALAPDGKTRYNAASWISGDLPTSDLPRTTLAEITRLAAMPDTATGEERDVAIVRSPWDRLPPLVVGSALALGAIAGWRRAMRTRRGLRVTVPPAN